MKSKWSNLNQSLWTDLIQAKLTCSSEKKTLFKLIVFLIKYRTARIHFFIRLRVSGIKFFNSFSKIYLDKFFIEIGVETKIGNYFLMPHPRCIIIANHVVIGNNVHVGQYVTIGGNFKKTKKRNDILQKVPILEDRIMVMPGAVIGGPVYIKNDVIISANAVVTKDVEANSMIFGQNKVAAKKVKLPSEGGQYKIVK